MINERKVFRKYMTHCQSDQMYLIVPTENCAPSKFELLACWSINPMAAFNSLRSMGVIVTKNGSLEEYSKFSNVVEFFIEKVTLPIPLNAQQSIVL